MLFINCLKFLKILFNCILKDINTMKLLIYSMSRLGTIKSRIHFARKLLKEQLEQVLILNNIH